MLTAIFTTLFKMTLQASMLICVVMLLRVLFRRVPKMYSCLLWMLVLIRLLCPVFIESSFSLIPKISGKQADLVDRVNIKPETSLSVNGVINDIIPPTWNANTSNPVDRTEVTPITVEEEKVWSVQELLILLWLIGCIVMTGIHMRQYIKMKSILTTAVRIGDNVWECEGISSPFVINCFKPRIYLPTGLEGIEKEHILKHERMHIRHFDPQIYLLEMIALCLHWWNPLVWLAIHKMNQDREMFCDEAVLRNADLTARKEYSNTLLQFAMKQSGLAVTLSFGETNTENRIKHILKYHKPKVIISILLIAVVAGCAIGFLTIPRKGDASMVVDGMDAGNSNAAGMKETNELDPAEVDLDETHSETKDEEMSKDSDDVHTKDPVITNEDEFAEMVVRYVETGNKEGLASYIKYPITVVIEEQQVVIYNSEEFLFNYNQIINDEVKETVISTNLQELFMNQYGVMLGNGCIWFDKFDSSGYQIYAINNSEGSIYQKVDFKTSWTNKTQHLGMSLKEMDSRYAKLLEDVPNGEGAYEIWGIVYEDLDRNGTMDLILQLKLATGAITPDTYPGAYLCIYMNEDPVYLKAYDSSMYFGFTQVLHADIDQDGYQEIIYNISTGGNGGAGSSEKEILKYKENSLVKMQFPGDRYEQFLDSNDVGYEVKVLFGSEDNKYKAVCDSLEKEIIFQANYAVDEKGKRMTTYITENDQAGANCRGYTEFSIVNKDGREYLRAKEYLHGEGGISHFVGWATFLMDWDTDGNPSVIEFGFEA
jgi:beta-lactamase regulating signal transducer with metallopeptidase domain